MENLIERLNPSIRLWLGFIIQIIFASISKTPCISLFAQHIRCFNLRKWHLRVTTPRTKADEGFCMHKIWNQYMKFNFLEWLSYIYFFAATAKIKIERLRRRENERWSKIPKGCFVIKKVELLGSYSATIIKYKKDKSFLPITDHYDLGSRKMIRKMIRKNYPKMIQIILQDQRSKLNFQCRSVTFKSNQFLIYT